MTWKKIDCIEEIRNIAIALLRAVPINVSEINVSEPFPDICCHPFTQSTIICLKNGEWLSILDQEGYVKWTNDIINAINNSDLNGIFFMVTSPYKLVFLKYTKEYMTKASFSKYLKDAYILSENPNMDINCSVSEIVRWFKNADKHNIRI